jgi:hypothetical protein
MNQYIITEEKLAEMVCDFYNGFFSAGSDIATTVRSHPYQSEREKVLDIICEWLRYNDPKGLYHYIKNELRAGE